MVRHLGSLLLLLGLLATVACQPVTPTTTPAATQSAGEEPATLVLASHDSFNVSEEVLAQFEAENKAKVQLLALGDAGEALNKVILSKDAPLADLFFGVDNTFLSRALAGDVFEPYASPQLAQIPDELELDPEHRLLPVDVGYINLNADAAYFTENNLPMPQTLEDLTNPAYKGLLVVMNPATSSPGLAFLLATINHFGEEGYLDFWQGLRANDVLITNGWSEAYFDHFTVGSGGSGDRPLVVSYTTSPPADVLYATDGRTEPTSVNLNLEGGVFRQIEFVGVLKGAQNPELAQKFIDFMLSQSFQADMPLQMFVYPAVPETPLPDLFTQFAEQPTVASQLDAAAIDANREQWIEAWTNTMLR
jgi:thiamine transport system substrate-binding protein